MNDLISRQAMVGEIEERLNANRYSNAALVSELIRLCGYAKLLPAIDPVKRGKWMAIGNTGIAACECGYITDRYSVYHYCPKCGAQMERN